MSAASLIYSCDDRIRFSELRLEQGLIIDLPAQVNAAQFALRTSRLVRDIGDPNLHRVSRILKRYPAAGNEIFVR